MRIVGKISTWVALLIGCTGPWPQGEDTGPRSFRFSFADSTSLPRPGSADQSCKKVQEASFWVLPPRLERRFAGWLYGIPAPHVARIAGSSMRNEGEATAGALEVFPPAPPWRIPALLDGVILGPGDTGCGFSPYDDLIRASAERHQLDWLLIASLIFQESRFNPCLASSAGAVGLAQVLPSTALELGILDPWEPGQNIEAGTRYFRRMYDAFGRLEEEDQVALALASYTAGLGHVLDACSLAAVDGRDPARWSENVEETLAQLSNADFAQRATHGGACGHQAVAFVNLVLRRWSSYAAARDSVSSAGIPN